MTIRLLYYTIIIFYFALSSPNNSIMANNTSTTTRTKNVLRLYLLALFSSEQVVIVNSFLTCRSIKTTASSSTTYAINYYVTKFYSTPLSLDPQEICDRESTAILLLGSHYVSLEEEHIFLNALESAGYSNVVSEHQKINHNNDDDDDDGDDDVYYYEFSKATGMLKLISSSPAQEVRSDQDGYLSFVVRRMYSWRMVGAFLILMMKMTIL
jgi:hypothetical protein